MKKKEKKRIISKRDSANLTSLISAQYKCPCEALPRTDLVVVIRKIDIQSKMVNTTIIKEGIGH